MNGACEGGICEVCGKDGVLDRTYLYFDYKCECHSPCHFIIVRHCSEHTPSLTRPEESQLIAENSS